MEKTFRGGTHKSVDEMIYKEANILFPNCAFNFYGWRNGLDIYRDSKDYAECFGVDERSLGGRREGTGRKDVVYQSG